MAGAGPGDTVGAGDPTPNPPESLGATVAVDAYCYPPWQPAATREATNRNAVFERAMGRPWPRRRGALSARSGFRPPVGPAA